MRLTAAIPVVLALAFVGGEAKGSEPMTTTEHDGARDFDFLAGRWSVHNKRLKERLVGSTEWLEFEATNSARLLSGGIGNEDVYRTDWGGGFVGLTFRFFDPKTRKWSIYWADSRRGTLDPPVVGSFKGDTGVFEGDDTWEGTKVRVRFVWSKANPDAPRWEQAFSTDGGKSWEKNWVMEFSRPADHTAQLSDLSVFELRRYVMKNGGREKFVRRFDTWAPEAFQQLGAVVLGQFTVRDEPNRFTWIRGWRHLDARAAGMSAFYYGPVWREHKQDFNEFIEDSDDVLLLKAYEPDRGVPVLKSVDPLAPPSPPGAVVLSVFHVSKGRVDEAAQALEPAFRRLRAAGIREAGLLTTLDEPNNFPQHPIRTDGPYLVWIGAAPDERVETKLRAEISAAAGPLSRAGVLDRAPEISFLHPTERSRLRWTER
jgi:NIPSNAP